MKNQANKRMIERRKLNNLCVGCATKLPDNSKHVFCDKCLERKKEENRDRRKWYSEHNICPRCGTVSIGNDEGMCPDCRAKAYVNIMKGRNREEYNKKHREWDKEDRAKCEKEGVCVRCRKRQASNGFKTCAICRTKIREQKRRRSNTQFNIEYKEKNGICRFCNEPVYKNYKVCEYHYNMCVEKLNNPACIEGRKRLSKGWSKIR